MISKGTHLNRQLMEELFMKQPIGFEDGTGGVCRLVKSIYGLRQAVLLRLHFEIVIWVDDMVGIVNTKETNDKFVEKLAASKKKGD
jgi:hypothetical protein